MIKKEEIRWVLTVPAIWSDFAKRFMRDDAIKASFQNVQNSKISIETRGFKMIKLEEIRWVLYKIQTNKLKTCSALCTKEMAFAK